MTKKLKRISWIYLLGVVFVCLFVVIDVSKIDAKILVRDTFEGPGEEPTWPYSESENGVVIRRAEDLENAYQTQAHGEKSLFIYDPDDNSYANACKTFINSSSEYMIEFYLWIYHTHSSIDSFILCELWNIPDEGLAYKTDIALVLDTVGMVPNHHPYAIWVEDANGMHFGAYIDSTDMWYKIQIHRYPDPPNPAVVDFYVDGELKGTFVPMNPSYVSNKISLGTTEETAESDGEVFYDDVSFADYTDFKNQITQIKNEIRQIENMVARVNYRTFKQYFTKDDKDYVLSLSNLLSKTFKSLTNYERMSYFNELIGKTDQIKLGLLYGDLTKKEKKLVNQSMKFVDKTFNKDYNLLTRNTQ
ncbi:MAG: hypothetical protein E3J87_01455 [Candidatus Cloacimonadota bacterium]|nr:MAG: hypothetical protein E3J87_01455 [Candidatus Cloacimonadota bacterium]